MRLGARNFQLKAERPKGAPAMEYAAPYLRLRSLSMTLFDLFVDIFFITDIPINFLTAFYRDSALITNHYAIARNYART